MDGCFGLQGRIVEIYAARFMRIGFFNHHFISICSCAEESYELWIMNLRGDNLKERLGNDELALEGTVRIIMPFRTFVVLRTCLPSSIWPNFVRVELRSSRCCHIWSYVSSEVGWRPEVLVLRMVWLLAVAAGEFSLFVVVVNWWFEDGWIQ